MLIPARNKNLLRKYEGVLFYSDSQLLEDRIYGFYLLVRPLLGWLKKELVALNLEVDEAESELYILCGALFRRFERDKSSIIPYLEKQLPWQAANLLKTIKKQTRPLEESPYRDMSMPYIMDEEFYWRVPGILFEDKYVGKCFTRGEKYLIYMILTTDDKNLSVKKLADKAQMDRRRMKDILSDISSTTTMEEIHA